MYGNCNGMSSICSFFTADLSINLQAFLCECYSLTSNAAHKSIQIIVEHIMYVSDLEEEIMW